MIEVIRFTNSEKSFFKENQRIRTQVFVNEQNVPKELEYEHEEQASHYLAFYNGVPCATARWRFTNYGIKLERFATIKAFRNKGLAASLLKRILDDTYDYNQSVYLNSQIDAVGFYEKYGFVKEGDSFFEAGIEHFKMIKV